MRRVDRPTFKPARCAAIPFIGPAGHPEEEWVDTGAEMEGWDNHIYLSATAIRQAMVVLGYRTPREVAEIDQLRLEAEEAAMRLLDEVKELEAQLDAITLLKDAGLKVTKA